MFNNPARGVEAVVASLLEGVPMIVVTIETFAKFGSGINDWDGHKRHKKSRQDSN